jgi:multidrug efflux pump subunit AcrA (membrane-fusion protein)
MLMDSRLATLKQVRTPRAARWFAWLLVLIFLVSPILLLALPWQQSFHATGRVIAFDATERQQDVEAPVDGRILKWHVKEGDRVKGPVHGADGSLVKPGDTIVSIQDPDPDLPRRLAEQRRAILERATAAKARIGSFTAQITALEGSRDKALEAARNRLAMSQSREKAAMEALTAARARFRLDSTNFRMEKDLRVDGLTSELAFQAALARQEQSAAEKNRAFETLKAASDEVKALDADIGTIRNNAEAAIASAKASRQSADAELAQALRDQADIDIRIARQATQEVTAPCDGTVFRILANASGGGALVKSGERLVVITPDIRDPKSRTVELYLDGNDAPQLLKLWESRGNNTSIPVRVQFEGWPAIQFVGWPSVAWGTFGGKVVFVDPHDDGKGRFRILVERDEDEADNAWPDAFSLRQGTRAQGWVLLDRVSLGYELWRRFNGFPPVVVGKDKDGDEMKTKPAKLRVPK